jgi:hypothetical protein
MTAVVTELVHGGGIAGQLVAVAGPDLHIAVEGKGIVVVDSRLMRGWGLGRLERATGVERVERLERPGLGGRARAGVPALSLPVREIRGDVQDGLF